MALEAALFLPVKPTPKAETAATAVAHGSATAETAATAGGAALSTAPLPVVQVVMVATWRSADPAARAAWGAIYADPERWWGLYELGEKLVDFEDYFRRWRFNHVTTVERIIGFKRGTGGTGGVSYLRKMLDVVLFPELWRLRTDL